MLRRNVAIGDRCRVWVQRWANHPEMLTMPPTGRDSWTSRVMGEVPDQMKAQRWAEVFDIWDHPDSGLMVRLSLDEGKTGTGSWRRVNEVEWESAIDRLARVLEES